MKKVCRKASSLRGIPFVRFLITVAMFVNWHKENYCSVSGKTLKICRSVVKIITVSEPTVRRKKKTVISCGFQISCHFMILAFVYSVITELRHLSNCSMSDLFPGHLSSFFSFSFFFASRKVAREEPNKGFWKLQTP